jgi:eukaryotic-like serine/threonine-protein kinase
MSENHVYALDVDKGKSSWKFKTIRSGKASPVIYNKTVFFGVLGRFYAVDMFKGKEIWSADVGDSGSPSAAAIDVENQTVIVECGRYAFSFDLKTGNKKWLLDNQSFMTFQTSIFDGAVFVGSDSSSITLRKLADGEEFSGYAGSFDRRLWHPAAFANGKIFASLGSLFEARQLNRVSPSEFKGNNSWYKTDGGYGEPSVAQDVVYVGCFTKRSQLLALDATSGQELWKHFLDHEISGSPYVKDGVVYLATNEGKIIALH